MPQRRHVLGLKIYSAHLCRLHMHRMYPLSRRSVKVSCIIQSTYPSMKIPSAPVKKDRGNEWPSLTTQTLRWTTACWTMREYKYRSRSTCVRTVKLRWQQRTALKPRFVEFPGGISGVAAFEALTRTQGNSTVTETNVTCIARARPPPLTRVGHIYVYRDLL